MAPCPRSTLHCNRQLRPWRRTYTFASVHTSSELPAPRLSIRNLILDIEKKAENAKRRKVTLPSIADMKRSYDVWKRLENEVNEKRHARTLAGERIRESAQAKDGAVRAHALDEATRVKLELRHLESALVDAEAHCLAWALRMPNDTHPMTPIGPEDCAVTLHTQHSTHQLPPADPRRDHLGLCRQLDLLDLESGATVTGSSWYFLKNEVALLELALINYAMRTAIAHGFMPMTTPDVVRADIAGRCGFQPRDDADPHVHHMYHLVAGNTAAPQLVLAGTAEIPLAGVFANKTYVDTALPLKIVGVGHAFRQEAGARSADTRGLYRVHQFTKVELFAVTTEGESEGMMEDMLHIQRSILDGLELPYRILDMPSEELGASAYRKIDIEAWMPGRGSWGEVSSLSNCTDYQSRRLLIRYKQNTHEPGPGMEPLTKTQHCFAHTINGTAAAIPRLIVALLENGALIDEEGKLKALRLPAVLRPFWIDMEKRDIIRWC